MAKFGIKTELGWVQEFSEYTTKGGNTKPMSYGSRGEAESAIADAGWKNAKVEELPLTE